MRSRSSSRSATGRIDKLDFDSNRKTAPSNDGSEHSGPHLLDDDESLLSDVVDGIIERDRRRMKQAVTRYLSFACAILNWYALRCLLHCFLWNAVLNMGQSLRWLHYRLLSLWPPLPISPSLYPASSQYCFYSRRGFDVPPRAAIWLPL